MLKIKLSIIYTIIFCLISSSFSELAAAQPSAPADLPPPILAEDKLATVTLEVTQGATFNLGEPTQEAIKKEMSSPKTLGEKFLDKGINTVQSFVIALVFLGVSWVREKAHERNMRLTPENKKQLVDEVGKNLSQARATTFSAFGTFDTGAISIALVAALTRNKAIDDFLQKEFGEQLFKYLVSGALFSMGTKWINGFVNAGAELVLNYRDKFGGLSQEEEETIRLLQMRGNFTFFLAEILFGIGNIAQDKHKAQVDHNVCWKIYQGIMFILFRDEELRSALWSHLTSSAILQGKNVILLFTMWSASQISNKILPKIDFIPTPVTDWGRFWENVGVLSTVGFLATFIPDQVSDWGTVKENDGAAVADRTFYLGRLTWYRHMVLSHPEVSDQSLRESLDVELNSRESRLIKYAYIMQLCLSRIDSYITARQTLIDVHNTGENNFSDIKKIVWLAGEAAMNLNDPSGFTYAKEMADPAKDLGARIVDEGPWTHQHALSSNLKGIGYYQDLFRKAADKMTAIYSNDEVTIQGLSSLYPSPRQQDRIALEISNLKQMEIYIRFVTNHLEAQWSAQKPTEINDSNRMFVEEASYWGIDENDVLQTINALRFPTPRAAHQKRP